MYLSIKKPEEGWDEYVKKRLVDTKDASRVADHDVINTLRIRNEQVVNEYSIDWSKVILSGHSQGAGHAAYIGKHMVLGRLVLISGPQEGLVHEDHKAESHHWLCSNTGG